MKRILISGAAGYLGRSTALYFLQKGYSVIGIDNFSSSSEPASSPFEMIRQDLRDFDTTLNKLKKQAAFDGIIHFAAKALVPESFQHPREYFENNLQSTLTLLESAQLLKIPTFVHSSTCAVYGIPKAVPISEATVLAPISPYGESKRGAEQMVAQYASLGVFKSLALRYFNPAGALKNSDFGECHNPETHLIPRLIEASAKGKAIEVFGRDYPTPDGTCIRDYIHVEDLCSAHQRALESLFDNKCPSFQCLNVGTGKGTSVLEAIRTVETVCKKPIETIWSERRVGDPPELVADVAKFKALFGWVPTKTLVEMVEDQWAFYRSSHK